MHQGKKACFARDFSLMCDLPSHLPVSPVTVRRALRKSPPQPADRRPTRRGVS
jgi:hypothetical protein